MILECDYKVVPHNGHFVVYCNGKFLCSADSWSEAAREIESHGNQMD